MTRCFCCKRVPRRTRTRTRRGQGAQISWNLDWNYAVTLWHFGRSCCHFVEWNIETQTEYCCRRWHRVRERVRDRQIVTASLLNMVLSFTLCVVTAHFIGIWQPIWYELNQLNANRKQITLEFQETCWETETEQFLITDNFNPRKITTCTVCSGIAAQSKLGWE